MNPVKIWYQNKLKHFFPPVRFAFAYGSAVFNQHGRAKGKMLDMIFAVDNAVEWHKENLKANHSHYSLAKHFGSKGIDYIQKFDAGVYYNSMLKIDNQLLKYGVISVEDLVLDLRTWKWLYVSGRLHKPVVILSDEPENDLLLALSSNLKSAALCGLLLLNGRFTEEDLFCAISSLSYQGDFRMYFGEDKNKVQNIVKPNLTAFKSLYEVHLRGLGVTSKNGFITGAHNMLHYHKDLLPSCVLERMEKGASLKKALSSIVLKSSLQQSCKGIISAGLIKSLKYSSDKIHKMFASL